MHSLLLLFFFNDTATTEIYTLSLHDALPILVGHAQDEGLYRRLRKGVRSSPDLPEGLQHLPRRRSEEHTSELQSRQYLVCRLLLEKKNNSTDCIFIKHNKM